MSEGEQQGVSRPAAEVRGGEWWSWFVTGWLVLVLGTILVAHLGAWILGRSLLWGADILGADTWAVTLGMGLLALSLLVTWLSTRRSLLRADRLRWGVVAVLVLGASYLGVRGWLWSAARDRGLWGNAAEPALWESCDLQYVRAVRARLRDLAEQLDVQVASRPAALAVEDKERLAVVEELQADMVSWAEQQVAHYLDDESARRGALALLAYQIQPRSALRAEAEAAFKREQQLAPQASQLARVVEAWPSADPAGGTAPWLDEVLATVDAPLRQWVRSAVLPAGRGAAVVEPVTVIQRRLEAVRARRAFLESHLAGLFSVQQPQGWNVVYSWLNLPRYVPGGQRWGRSWCAATTVHMLLVAWGLAVLVHALLSRRARVLQGAVLIWSTVAGMGLLAFAMFGA